MLALAASIAMLPLGGIADAQASISIGANNLGTFTLAQQTNAYLTFSASTKATISSEAGVSIT